MIPTSILCHSTINPKQTCRCSCNVYVTVNPISNAFTRYKSNPRSTIPTSNAICILSTSIRFLCTNVPRSMSRRRSIHFSRTNLYCSILWMILSDCTCNWCNRKHTTRSSNTKQFCNKSSLIIALFQLFPYIILRKSVGMVDNTILRIVDVTSYGFKSHLLHQEAI